MTDRETGLRESDTDRIASALVTLAQELWVIRDRQLVLEAALVRAGLIAEGDVDTYVPDASLRERLAGERERLIGGLVDSLVTEASNQVAHADSDDTR